MTSSLDSKKLEWMKLKVEHLKGWVTIIAIVASLGTAITAHFKEEEDNGAKDVYKELSGAIEKVSEDQVKLHSDIAAIRGYLAGKAQAPSPAIVRFLDPPSPAAVPRHIRPTIAPKPKTKAIIEEEPNYDVPQLKPAPNKYQAPPVEQVTKN
jgi:hypothetical protein